MSLKTLLAYSISKDNIININNDKFEDYNKYVFLNNDDDIIKIKINEIMNESFNSRQIMCHFILTDFLYNDNIKQWFLETYNKDICLYKHNTAVYAIKNKRSFYPADLLIIDN